jgi:hypothetical protein
MVSALPLHSLDVLIVKCIDFLIKIRNICMIVLSRLYLCICMLVYMLTCSIYACIYFVYACFYEVRAHCRLKIFVYIEAKCIRIHFSPLPASNIKMRSNPFRSTFANKARPADYKVSKSNRLKVLSKQLHGLE